MGDSSISKTKRTPFGARKFRRKQLCKKAAQSRWEVKTSSDQVSESLNVRDVDSDCQQHDVSQHETLHHSTARRKLNVMREYVDGAEDTEDNERCFFELPSLRLLVSKAACQDCGGKLTVAFGQKMGYSREIQLVCEECTFKHQQYSCARLYDSSDITTGFEINQAMVLCFSELGHGEAALRKFSAVVSVPGLSHRTYQRVSKKVVGAQKDVTANVLNAAVQAVHDLHDSDHSETDFMSDVDGSDDDDRDVTGSDTSMNDTNVNVDSGECGHNDVGDYSDCEEGFDDAVHRKIVDVTVSFDGTWHKRGFTSNYGVGVVIDVSTGLVLDFEVLSKYCQGCSLNSKREMTDTDRQSWEREHAPFCEKNYDGSLKAMEKEAALRLWGRSILKNNMRYTRMLSDGDSVAYKAVCDANFYPVEKLECINHCDKRMGTALRNKAKEAKLGGRRHGALTANTCKTLQSYYRNAILQNLGNAEKMRQAILASLLHCSSTDRKPQHHHCPEGPTSWCFFNRSVANNQKPPPHKDHIGTPLSADVVAAIQPIYERMSDPSLLKRIRHGRTQNANECLNGQIWARCPKTTHVGASRVNAAVASAVSHFNQGYSHLSQVTRELGGTPSSTLKEYQDRQDLKRCKQADMSQQPDIKRARKANKKKFQVTTNTQEKKEGQTYGSGAF